MSGRTAIVTDGAYGLGGAVAQRLAADGAAVAVFDVEPDGATETVAAIEADGGVAAAYDVDVADRCAVDTAVADVRARLGRPTILVNSGEASSIDGFLDIETELWQRMLEVNLTGTFNCCQAVLPDMIEAGWGRIVNLTSAGVHDGRARRAHYIAAKSSVHGLTKTLALEFACHGITVNAIPTGMVERRILREVTETGLVDFERELAATPVGRAGRPADVAAACAFLVSDEASYITGQILGVNGGRNT